MADNDEYSSYASDDDFELEMGPIQIVPQQSDNNNSNGGGDDDGYDDEDEYYDDDDDDDNFMPTIVADFGQQIQEQKLDTEPSRPQLTAIDTTVTPAQKTAPNNTTTVDATTSTTGVPKATTTATATATATAATTKIEPQQTHEQPTEQPQQTKSTSQTGTIPPTLYSAKECIKNCVRFGRVMKKGNNRSGLKEWRQRVLVLNALDRHLYYYKTMKDKTPLGIIPIHQNSIIKRGDSGTATVGTLASGGSGRSSTIMSPVTPTTSTTTTPTTTAVEDPHRRFVFRIERYDEKKPEKAFVVSCASERELNDWMQALLSASGRSLNVSPHATVQQMASGKWFRTIGEAVEAAYGGEKIHVHSGVYREQLVLQKSVILEGVISREAQTRHLQAKKQFDELKKRKETVIQERENIYRAMSIRVGQSDMHQQHSALSKQQDAIRKLTQKLPLDKKNATGTSSSSGGNSAAAAATPVADEEIQLIEASGGFAEFGNMSDVVLECPIANQPTIIYKTNGGTLSNMTISSKDSRSNASQSATPTTPTVAVQQQQQQQQVNLVRTMDDPMVNCIEIDNGSLKMNNCTVYCHTGSGILCMNSASLELDNCDVYKARDIGVWAWDRSLVTMNRSRVYGSGIDGIHLNGKSTVKLDSCQIVASGLFGVCAVDASVCHISNCKISHATADAVRVQNDAHCHIAKSEVSYSSEYGIGSYNQLDLMEITVDSCKLERNKLGDFAQKSQIKFIH